MRLDATRAKQILSLIDLTSLKGHETSEDIVLLCESADSRYGKVAAICVYPQYICQAKEALATASDTDVKVATVVNFPGGDEDIDEVTEKTLWSVEQGADEVDVVLPYNHFLNGDIAYCESVLSACREACGDSAKLKVIIESGVLAKPELIKQATELAIQCGADFVKTSTGKVPVNATLEAAEIMLGTIRASGRKDVGFKASGGIRRPEEAAGYLMLAEQIMGKDWINADHFRFGVSALLDNLLAELDGAVPIARSGY